MLRNWFILFLMVILLITSGGGWLYYNHYHVKKVDQTLQALQTVTSVEKVQKKYDVIVVGTDPEGITAAVSAARNGLKTLLVDGRDRKILGGLMTLGWLNSLDMNRDYAKESALTGTRAFLNEGLFLEWYNMIEGDSFDVRTAANAFYKMVKKEKNIDLLLETQQITPLLKSNTDGNQTIEGLKITKKDGIQLSVLAASIIDATQDADIAFAAGAPFTLGREDLGDKQAKMAVTQVFRLKNVTPEVWKQVNDRLNNDDSLGTGANATSAWGYAGMYAYKPLNPENAKMRGLNIGRQNDNTFLSNSLLLYNVDPFDANSRKKAVEVAQKELPHVVEFLKKTFPEFAGVELDGIAPELYVRETRHLIGEYRLSIIDELENKDQWDRIAFGSYEADIQPSVPSDGGNIILDPIKYAIPFRSIIPQKVDGLLVVGRSASYDSLAHGSARVIPNGMAEGEAAGVAAKVAKEHKTSFRQMSKSKELVAQMQSLMNKQGMDIQPYKLKNEPYMDHKDYAGLKAAVYLGLANGSYGNKSFDLDGPSNRLRIINHFRYSIQKKYPTAFPGTVEVVDKETGALPVSLAQLCYTISEAMNVKTNLEESQAELVKKKLLTQATIDSIKKKDNLTNGDVFQVINDVLAVLVDLRFE
jgi:hypothetical protein